MRFSAATATRYVMPTATTAAEGEGVIVLFKDRSSSPPAHYKCVVTQTSLTLAPAKNNVAKTMSTKMEEINLVDVVSISAKPFPVSKLETVEHDRPALSDTLERFVFKDPDLEARSLHVCLCVDGGGPNVEFLTFVKDTTLVEELLVARDVAFVRRALLLDPSSLSASTLSQSCDTRPLIIRELQASVRVIVPVEDFSQQNFRSKKSQHRQKSAENALLDDLGGVGNLLRRLEGMVTTDAQLKREFFSCSELLTILLNCFENLDNDLLNTFRNNQPGAIRRDDEDDVASRARAVQLALVQRATAGLRIICAALHDSRSVDERFQLLCLPDWPINKLVDTLATDCFNYTEQSLVQAIEVECDPSILAQRPHGFSSILCARDVSEKGQDQESKDAARSANSNAEHGTVSALFQAAAAQESLRKNNAKHLRGGGREHKTPPSNDAAAPKSTPVLAKSTTGVATSWAEKHSTPFMYDPWSTVAFADAHSEPDDLRHFAALLDAQVSLLWQLDQLTAAWCRERRRVKTPHGAEVFRDMVPKLISRDTGHASQLLEAIVERSIAITLELSQDYESTLATEEKGHPPRQRLAERRVALLSHARFLAAMVRCSYENRQIAASNHTEDMENFLQQDDFYKILAKDRLTLIAGQSLMEATGLAMNGKNTSEMEEVNESLSRDRRSKVNMQ